MWAAATPVLPPRLSGPTVVMMVGLQGAGKTTNCAKLAGLMRRQYGKQPLLVACDVYRPLPSSSCRWWASSWTFPFLRWARATR